jgi:hypothetical protein
MRVPHLSRPAVDISILRCGTDKSKSAVSETYRRILLKRYKTPTEIANSFCDTPPKRVNM